MNCMQFRRYSDAIADGEVDTSVYAEAAGHLDQCPQCAREVEGIRGLKSTLERTWGDGQVPQHLRNRVLAMLQTEVEAPSGKAVESRSISPGPPPYAYFPRFAVAAAVGLAAAAWLLAPWSGQREGGPVTATARVVAEVRAQHRVCVTRHGVNHHDPSLSRDLPTIAERLSRRLNLAVIAPDLSKDGFALLGADRCGIPGHPGAHILYESPSTGTTLSVYTVEPVAALKPNPAGPPGVRRYFAAVDEPETVLAWHDAGQTYIACGEVDEARMKEMMGHVRVADVASVQGFFIGMIGTRCN